MFGYMLPQDNSNLTKIKTSSFYSYFTCRLKVNFLAKSAKVYGNWSNRFKQP